MQSIEKKRKRAKQAGVSHGILLVVLFSLAAYYIADFPAIKKLQFSPLIVGILIGMMYANSLRNRLPATWIPGIIFCSKKLLRLGIMLYGFRLTLQDVFHVGTHALIVDVLVVICVMLLGVLVGKILKMDKELTLFTTIGSAVCGAAAVLGAEPVIQGKPYKAAVAVATVVIFGTTSMFLLPALYNNGFISLDPQQMGIYTGATVHEVAHVVGAGDAMNDTVIASTAVIVKMIRVILLAPLLLILGYLLSLSKKSEQGNSNVKRKITIPWFAVIFLGVIALNSLINWANQDTNYTFVNSTIAGINAFDTFILTMAMTALGMETNVKSFKKAGVKPFILAFILFLFLIFGGFFLTKYVSLLF